MFYKKLIRPWLFDKERFPDPEDAHNFVLGKLQLPELQELLRLYAVLRNRRYPLLEQTLWGVHFPHPIGLAAGFDKNGVALHPLVNLLGVSFVEMGGITQFAQGGNPQPRIFRSEEDRALINRMGFNNDGAEQVANRLAGMEPLPIWLGLNVGKSKATPIDVAEDDYRYTIKRCGPYVDYFTVNVSSPNTPDLRKLQEKKRLAQLLDGIREEVRNLPREYAHRTRPVLVKFAPDLTHHELDEALEVADEYVHGIIATNTTLSRDGLTNKEFAGEVGGLSGAPLRDKALGMVSYIRRRLPNMPIVGVGGIFNGDDAYRMILAGANLVQVYTGVIYEGPGMVRRALKTLNNLLNVTGRAVTSFSPHATSPHERN